MRLRPAVSIGSLLIFLSVACGSGYAQKYTCLPDDVREDAVVGFKPGSSQPITTRQALKRLKAKCSRSVLLDRRRRRIVFYRMQGCWGNPPADYQDILARQSKEVSEMKKKFTVIEIPCDTTGNQIQRIL